VTTFEELVVRAHSLVRDGRRVVLGITGSPGSGKTTLAENLAGVLLATPPVGWVAHVPMDGFHLADVELDRLGRRGSKGAPDTFDVTGYVALLRRIREDADDMIYAPAFDRALGQPIAGSIPIPRAARLIISEGNYLLLRGGDWACARSEFDEVWYCDLAEGERVRRLVARHERFGKDHDAALAWAMGTDQRNADLISLTRSSADLVIGDVVFQGLQEAAHAYRAADVGAGGKVAIIMDQRRLQHPL